MISGDNWVVHFGSCLDVLPTLADNSVDSIVTDPPYELGFMGKKWDSTGIAFSAEVWAECLRVLKPGGHLLAFGGSRTWHRIAVAIEDAGFEVRDSIAWLYGSGFPKSLDISKAIDKAAGAEREKVRFDASEVRNPKAVGNGRDGTAGATRPWIEKAMEVGYHEKDSDIPATPEAERWQGWGTALKPAFEPIVVARKPLIGTVAANVLEYGTGGLNIDGTRIAHDSSVNLEAVQRQSSDNPIQFGGAKPGDVVQMYKPGGRWPANVILDEYTAELLDEQSGVSVSKAAERGLRISGQSGGLAGAQPNWKQGTDGVRGHNDSGGASRFFYVAKASKRDRNEGLDQLAEQEIGAKGNGLARTCATCSASVLDGCECPDRTFVNPTRKNFHPTVKPTTLMRHLVKLVTPPGGTVLDPFTGSGSTGKAAILEGFQFIGIELTEDYLPIIEGRLVYANEQAKQAGNDQPQQEQLF